MPYHPHRRSSRPRARGLTPQQQQAHDAANAACDHQIVGRFARGDVVAGHDGHPWKIMTYGIRYHEDRDDRVYGVQPVARGPKGWSETCALRSAIERIQREGVRDQPRPEIPHVAAWRDGEPNSYASFPVLTIYEGGIVGVYCPIYDDAPIVAWVHDPKLARSLLAAIQRCPAPVHLPRVEVRERTVRLTIDPTHSRYAAYAAPRGAAPFAAIPASEFLGLRSPGVPGGITLPRAEHRRITAELDAAGVPH